MKTFNREAGVIDPAVIEARQRYDIRLILEQNWTRLAPKLNSKINVICGDFDTFRLEKVVKMLCGFFREKGSDAVCELVLGWIGRSDLQ